MGGGQWWVGLREVSGRWPVVGGAGGGEWEVARHGWGCSVPSQCMY